MPIFLRKILLGLVPVVVLASDARGDSKQDQIPLLIEALADANLRNGASIALTKLGGVAVPALRVSLVSENPNVRIWSAYTLGEIGRAADSAVQELAEALASSDPALRAAAAQALGKIGPAAATATGRLAAALADENEQVRKRAAVALGQLGPQANQAVPQLIAALSDSKVRIFARRALVQIGPGAAEALLEARDQNEIRFDVAIALSKIDPDAAREFGLAKKACDDLPSLRLVLHDVTRDPADRSAAALALAWLGKEGASVLVAAFEEKPIARTAASAFAKADASAVPLLIEVLGHDDPEVRATAADALGLIGPAASDAAPHLIQLLKDQDRNVRYHAVRALHELGQNAKPAVPALSEIILNSSEQEPTRQWAIKTLVMTLPATKDDVVKALIEASKEETNYGVRQLARQQLQTIDPKAAEAAGIK